MTFDISIKSVKFSIDNKKVSKMFGSCLLFCYLCIVIKTKSS
nr:MAG TPA: hypothetical protein [Caudoviricetes sp.]